VRVNKTVVHELREAERRLKALCSVGDQTGCTVEDEHKEAVRLYVETWITPLVRSALDRIEGRKATKRGEHRR
jgi:hypothetical protein